ncbi:hypothetical protein F4561_000867 [Lipingzhangella halophila]|uniref:Uncharacterized protein n=1 Tax=Lipingzhangella halophila TaxID=1783352 RepID=A0A7W7RDL1_9ACTN|nr:hypothetical protein [Lipingzhangella halophila]MBB4930047.1 hypothetical protein [Lipingzhangella halophila]
MLFAVHIRTRLPDHSADLDGLSAHGAVHLVLAELDTVLRVHGPDGVVVTPREIRCQADQRGLSIKAAVEAPSAHSAETALRLTVRRVLAERAEFAGWSVATCRAQSSFVGVPAGRER